MTTLSSEAERLAARLEKMRGPFLGDGINEGVNAYELAALLRRIPELEAERDLWRDAERSLSESYVRIREAIGAMRPPSLETDALWSYVEQTARDLVAERDQLRSALSTPAKAQPAPVVPDGWKLVPVEPTKEMLASVAWPECAKTDWNHMLTASPTPPAQQGEKS